MGRRLFAFGSCSRMLLSAGCAAALGAAALAQTPPPDFQFRINAVAPRLGWNLTPPTIGMVRGGSGVNGNVQDAMVFSWTDLTISAVPIPVCEIECGPIVSLAEFGGGGRGVDQSAFLYLRRFDNAGVPLDTGDPIVAGALDMRDGPLQTPSLGVRPVNTGAGLTNPFRLAWWNMWSWADGNPACGMPTCGNQPVGWWTVWYNNFNPTLTTQGSADFAFPAACRSHRPSVAFSTMVDMVAWRDVSSACRQIWAGFDGVYQSPPTMPSAVVIRTAQSGIDVDRPCAAWAPGEEFVVAWRQDDLATFQSAIFMRRVWITGLPATPTVHLGQIVEVASYGEVAPGSGPAVSMFDDRSFVVQWVGFNNGDPPILPLHMQAYDAAEPPLTSGPRLDIVDGLFGTLNHSVTARGATLAHSSATPSRISSIYDRTSNFGTVNNVYGKAVRYTTPNSAIIGPETVIPLDSPVETNNRLGEPHQHTALLRSDEKTAVTWLRGADGNVYATVRTLPLPNPCLADFDENGFVNIDDLFQYLNAWFGSDPRCDVDGNGQVNIDDLFQFINIWFAGC